MKRGSKTFRIFETRLVKSPFWILNMVHAFMKKSSDGTPALVPLTLSELSHVGRHGVL